MSAEQTLEQVFSNALDQYLKSAAFEEMMHNHMAAAFEKSFKENLRGWDAPAQKIIEKKMKEMLVPAIESYNFNHFETKLVTALDEMIKINIGPTAKILDKFREFVEPTPEYITVEDVFRKYCDIYEKEMDTEDVEVTFDDGDPHYENATLAFNFVEDDDDGGGSRKYATLDLYIEDHPSSYQEVVDREKEKHHLKFRLWQPKLGARDDFWEKGYKRDCEEAGIDYKSRDLYYLSTYENANVFVSLRHAELTKIMAFNLVQHTNGIIITSSYDNMSVTSNQGPEPTWQ